MTCSFTDENKTGFVLYNLPEIKGPIKFKKKSTQKIENWKNK